MRYDQLLENSGSQNPVIRELEENLNAVRQNIVSGLDNQIHSSTLQLTEARETRISSYQMVASPAAERKIVSIERQQKIRRFVCLFAE